MSDQNILRKETLGTALVNVVRNNMRQYTMIAALLLIWIIFSFFTKGIFLSPRNLSNLFIQMTTIGILTCGMVLVMVAGNIDLSVGSVCGTLGALVAWLMVEKGIHPAFAIMITLAAGFAVGCWHGYWIAFRNVVPWVVTLASFLGFRGVTLAITKGFTIAQFPAGFKIIGQEYFLHSVLEGNAFRIATSLIFAIVVIAFVVSQIFTRRKRIQNGFNVLPLPFEIAKIVIICAGIIFAGYVMSSYRGIPYAIIILLTVAVIFTIITTLTKFGRHVYAIGGNIEAARLSGVNVRKTVMGICMLMGLLSAVAAIVFTSRLNAATSSAGSLFELDAIAACIIGGTATSGGIGTIFGALIGALVMASLDNGMSLMNLPIMYQYIVKGMVLLIAVWIDISNRKK